MYFLGLWFFKPSKYLVTKQYKSTPCYVNTLRVLTNTKPVNSTKRVVKVATNCQLRERYRFLFTKIKALCVILTRWALQFSTFFFYRSFCYVHNSFSATQKSAEVAVQIFFLCFLCWGYPSKKPSGRIFGDRKYARVALSTAKALTCNSFKSEHYTPERRSD